MAELCIGTPGATGQAAVKDREALDRLAVLARGIVQGPKLELGGVCQRAAGLVGQRQIELLGLFSLVLRFQGAGQTETAIILQLPLRKAGQGFAKEPSGIDGVPAGQGDLAQIRQDEGVQPVLGVFRQKPLQVRLGGGVVAGQVGRFADAEQCRPSVLPLRLAGDVFFQVCAGVVVLAQLKQRLAEEKKALVMALVVGKFLQKSLELIGSQFPTSLVVVRRGDGILVVRLAGGERCSRCKQESGGCRDDH